ncbi:MAG: 3-hydroxyacyl-CoA dehydrogenase NAD-binding domain-containing protein [Gemmatimonadota bacterium]
MDDAGLAEVVFDVLGRSVNTFDAAVLQELESLVEELEIDARVTVAVFSSGKPAGFIAGADIAEIAAVVDPDDARRKVVRGQRVFQSLAELPFPTLAAIHGACLGGGLELALACSHRIAAVDAELGLPEVNLGIFPAWGGTQRLARLVGPLAAVDLICSARRVDGKKALRLGLVDRTSPPGEVRARALAFARELVERRPGRRAGGGGSAGNGTSGGEVPSRRGGRGGTASGGRLRRRALEGTPLGRRILFHQARKRIVERTGGHYPAPLRALQAIEEGIEGSLEAGLALEARLVSDLIVSAVSKNLIHVYELFESVKKSPWAAAPAGERPLARAAVVGAGVMGGGIAQLLAQAGIAVRLKDLEPARVAEGLRAARAVLEGRRRRGRIDRHALRRQMNRIAPSTTYAGFGRAELVVEAIVEDLAAKSKVFGELETVAPREALLCTNTSSLAVERIAAGLHDPARAAGLHFFNPVDRMPLVEVVRARETSDEAVGRLYRLALRLKKKPVVVKDSPGYLVNRLLMPYLNEAVHLLEEGASIEAVDRAMTAFGMPVGPLALLDDVGLDVASRAGAVLAAAFPERMQPAALMERLQALGRSGRKGGRGFYLYEGESRKGVDPELRRELRHARGPAADAVDLERRLVFPMVNEAALCLSEGVVESPAELDLAMLAGTGFPPFRGGLLRHADAVGVQAIVAGLERLSEGRARLAPSPALRAVGARGGFYAAAGRRRGSTLAARTPAEAPRD